LITIEQLNEKSSFRFIELLGDIFEHSPWIAEKVETEKPFHSIQQLHEKMVEIVKNATYEQQLALMKAHPNLGERVKMTKESKIEQQSAGLNNLTEEEYVHFVKLNQAYMDKFGFPFIMAVRFKTKNQIYQALEKRIYHNQQIEFETALSEIYKIARFRLEEKFSD